MEVTHRTTKIRIAPRKLRLVAEKVKHMPAAKALELLPLVNRGGALHVRKSLKAAIAAAEDQNYDKDTLVIQRIWCDEGANMKRYIGHSRGRTSGIMKKHSHLSIVLKGEQFGKAAKAKPAKAQKPEDTIVEQEK